MYDRYSCILPDSNLKMHQKSWKKKTLNNRILFIRSLCTKWCQLAKSNVNDVISANNVDVNKSIDKMLTLGRNIMQTNLDLS